MDCFIIGGRFLYKNIVFAIFHFKMLWPEIMIGGRPLIQPAKVMNGKSWILQNKSRKCDAVDWRMS